MSLCEGPTHWLPQNPLSFIINILLLITPALIHNHARPKYEGRGGGGRAGRAGGREGGVEEKERVLEKRGAKGMWDAQRRTINRFGGVGGGRVRPVTCGNHPPHLHFILLLIFSTSHTCSAPLFIFLLKCSNFYGLWETGGGWLQRQANDSDRNRSCSERGRRSGDVRSSIRVRFVLRFIFTSNIP